MKRKITVSFAIITIIVMAIGVMGGLAGISLYSHKMRDDMQHRVKVIEESAIAIENLKIEFLMARRAEKDFLLRLDPKYSDRHAGIMEKMWGHLAVMEGILGQVSDLTETAQNMAPLIQFAHDYQDRFKDVVASNERLGLTNSDGLRGELEAAAETVNESLKDVAIPVLKVNVLTMRQHEKDFIISSDTKWLDEVNARIKEFEGFPVFFYDSAEQREAILPVMTAYKTAFEALVNETLKERGFRKDMSKSYANASPYMDTILEDVTAALDAVLHESEVVSQKAQLSSQWAAIGGASIFAIFALILARGISRPLKRIDAVLKDMMNEDFSKEMPNSGIRELSAISEAVGDFRKQEETKVHMTREISKVIEACGDGDFSRRIDTAGSEGVFKDLGQGVNAIGEVAQKGLGDVQETLEILATGDLTHEMPEGQKGVFKDISNTITHLTDSLDGMVRQLSASGKVLNHTSQEISSSVDDASRRGEISAASLEETSSSLQTVAQTVNDTAKSAQEARSHVNNAQKKAESTREVADQTVAAIQKIKESSDAISQISGLIEDVAFQTNLLALNAGVEAARAGDAGRGFAVVASEVRALAQRSSEAAHEINTLISSSQTEVANGVNLMDETGNSLGEIMQAVEQVVGKVREIAENAVDQSTGLKEVSAAVESLDSDSQKSAAMLEETAASGQVLRGEAENLVRAVDGFTLKDQSSNRTAEDDLDDAWDAA
ncbi:methyl-accepting chemotaxis protein [Shimia sagamensis]|uniref:Methyl-accepting chemotaxis protein n=1 Tax=Shimia sagamensis TaxID=1566352 RepID=A0ABY1NUR1_9RHOB|nr:methyl-accepting chemotaxis protein [Shimia sagamensis]SMP18775.1 methyl-accepting chemotaxis protein [Shimia sagamensis]